MAWIGDVIAYERRQPVLARFLIGQILGLSGGVALGGYAADHLQWRTPFVLIALGFVLIAAWLLVPYISWVSFATILNYTIWKLNS